MITTLAEAEAHQRKHGFLPCDAKLLGHPKPRGGDANATGDFSASIAGASESSILSRRRKQTKTEAEYGLILESKKRKGLIDDYEFEGMTLKWGGLRYTPDYVVSKTIPIECESCGKTHTRLQTYIRLIEIKGGHIWEDSIVKFKAARARWPQFVFEMMQKKGGQWQRIY